MINVKKHPKRKGMRLKRAQRVRAHVRGDSKRPRLCVVKTGIHLHAQIIDDEHQTTLVGLATNSKGFKGTEFGKKGVASAAKLGIELAERAKAKGIEQVVFDRGPSKYHGLLAALAQSARESGLKF